MPIARQHDKPKTKKPPKPTPHIPPPKKTPTQSPAPTPPKKTKQTKENNNKNNKHQTKKQKQKRNLLQQIKYFGTKIFKVNKLKPMCILTRCLGLTI